MNNDIVFSLHDSEDTITTEIDLNMLENLNTIENIDNTEKPNYYTRFTDNIENDVISEFYDLTSNIPYEKANLEIIFLNSDDEFIKNRHLIIKGHYVVVDIKDSHLIVITEEKKAFHINLSEISEQHYLAIFNDSKPKKITLDSKSLFRLNSFKTINGLYNIFIIINMFYPNKICDLNGLLETFMNKTYSEDTHIECLYNLLHIKNCFNIILEKNHLMKLLNKESKLLEIVIRCEEIGLPFSNKVYEEYLKDIKESFEYELTNFTKKYNKEFTNNIELFQILTNNNLDPVLDLDYLKQYGDETLFALLVGQDIINRHSEYPLSNNLNRLYIEYTPYDDFGGIRSNIKIDNFYVVSDKKIVVGYYKDLYLRIFANYSNIDYIVDGVKNNNLEHVLSKKVLGFDTNFSKFLIISVLKGMIQGYFYADDMRNYLFEECNIYINLNDMEEILKRFNDHCPEVISFISGFNRYRSLDKRYSLVETTPLHKFIMLLISDIHKDSILRISESTDNFNMNNKFKIDIVGLFDNKIILESDNECINIAVDLMNRNLSHSFYNYISKVPILCKVIGTNRLKGD